MGKITDEMYKDATESVLALLAMFQTGFKTICEENPDLEIGDKIALADKWWHGQMYFMAHCGNNNKGLM